MSSKENVSGVREQSQVGPLRTSNSYHTVVNPPQASLKPDTRARNLSALATTASPLVDHSTTEQEDNMLVEDSQKGEAETKGHGKSKGKVKTASARKSKGKAKAMVKGKKASGGRAVGSKNFGNQEISKLLKLMGEYIPIGSKGWERVALLYNVWGEKGGFKSRDHRSLRDKYDRLLKEALSKPSSEMEHDPTTVFGCIHIINDKMEKKANKKTLDDDNSDVSPIDVDNHVDGGMLSQDVIELSDSDKIGLIHT
ncbi:hypothetical protein BDQ17DRAFT_1414086 [Cyathus striatus]|nr:hypothetical protein BDQ17DRAFT_1414086 [Cyathus striatus]